MKFEDLENLWNEQQPPAFATTAAMDMPRSLGRELARRGRMFGYSYFFLALGLTVTPLLAIVNFNYARPHNVFLFLLNVLLVVTLSMIVLIGTIRKHRRHRTLARAKADSLCSFLTASVANLESELQDFRVSRWCLTIGMGVSLLAIYVNQPITKVGLQPFAIRALAVFGATILFVWVVNRHCRKNLKPELIRRRNMLDQMS
jgi:hypothetical protein